MTKETIKEFIKKHKGKLAIGLAAGTGIVIWLITKDKSSNYIDIPRPELSTGEWTQLWKSVKGKYKDGVAGCVTGIDITDLGNFGDALATIEGIDGHEKFRIIIGTEKSYV